jgi:hypothetical protein
MDPIDICKVSTFFDKRNFSGLQVSATRCPQIAAVNTVYRKALGARYQTDAMAVPRPPQCLLQL